MVEESMRAKNALAKKKILISCTDVMMIQFILPHVKMLSDEGCIVDLACSSAEGYQSEGYHEKIKKKMPEKSHLYSINLHRSPFSPENIKGLRQLKKIINENHYDLVWTNEPVMGVMTRLAAKPARKRGTKVFYLVHGYHFFNGAPPKNWVYYPVEKIMSNFCDAIGTINWEDYYFTKKHMPRKNVFHIDGIGFDAETYSRKQIDREKKRRELGLGKDDICVLSVGELQPRKNHEPMIRAIGKLTDKRVKYLICGWGELKEHLLMVASEVGITDNFQLLGHRYDISEILQAADIFAHPSRREGLGIAVLEAMATGLPLVTSDVQGLKDFVYDGKGGFCNAPNDIDGYKKSLEKLISSESLRKSMGIYNQSACRKYDSSHSKEQIYSIILEVLNE